MTVAPDPARIELAMLEADLNLAIRNADSARILHNATAMDRLARSLGADQHATARRAQAAVAQAITALEAVLDRSRHEPRQTRRMRAVYSGTVAPS